MTRREKLMKDYLLSKELVKIIRGLNYFPVSFSLRVCFTRREPNFCLRRPSKRCHDKKRKTLKTQELILMLRRNWLETVYEQGIAVVCDRFTLKARPAIIPEGAENAWCVTCLVRPNDPWWDTLHELVLYAGAYCLAGTAHCAMGLLIEKFEQALLDKPPF